MSWIPITDRQPKDYQTVLFVSEGKVYAGYYDKSHYYFGYGTGALEPESVTHWMPLPDPPTEPGR